MVERLPPFLKEYLTPVVDAVADRSPPELIGALLVALLVSLTATGLFALWRRRTTDPLMLVTYLTLPACVLSMTLSAAYLQNLWVKQRTVIGQNHYPARPGPPPGHGSGPPPFPFGGDHDVAGRLVAAADGDGDGRISRDELVSAAERLLQRVDPAGEGAVDVETLRVAIRDEMRPAHHRPPQPPDPPAEPAPERSLDEDGIE